MAGRGQHWLVRSCSSVGQEARVGASQPDQPWPRHRGAGEGPGPCGPGAGAEVSGM